MGKAEGRFSGMESEFSGFVLDPAKCSQLSLEEKRELVHEIAQWSKDAPGILRSWTRRELLEIICAEMGLERKYTGFTKFRMIEHLLKLVSENSGKVNPENDRTLSKTKRQKKKDDSLPYDNRSVYGSLVSNQENLGQPNMLVCKNLACRATPAPQDRFCRRCSCGICYLYDDNKDTSLWLTCGTDPPTKEHTCGISYHLKCALKHEMDRIMTNDLNGCYTKLDVSFRCVCCGRINNLMGSWRKQLLVAKDANTVDVLCDRLSLSYKMLKGTTQYKDQQRIVDSAVKKLENEVGPLDRLPSEMAPCGTINRIACNAEVQRLCASAVQSFDSMPGHESSNIADTLCQLSCDIRFEEASPISVVVVLEYDKKLLRNFAGCKLWHRRSTALDYPEKPDYIVLKPEKRFLILGLYPSTEYLVKVLVFSCTRKLGEWEANFVTHAENGSSIVEEHGEEQSLVFQANSQKDSTNSSDNSKLHCEDYNYHSKFRLLEDISKKEERNAQPSNTIDAAPMIRSLPLPLSSSKSDGTQNVPECGGRKQEESNYEYCVRVIKWLEHEEHMEKDFRVKFLTWFSLRSTMRERRVVSAFVDILIDDPPSLAAQLLDTFMDVIDNDRKPMPPSGFCTRLWH